MSIIIDGMDQGKCLMPYAGRMDHFANAMHQHVTGVKEHGVGLTIYRSTETVGKGANLTIHCILDRLEKFYQRHHYYPETLYVQVDGGSENANRFLLGMLELLAVKRVCKDIWYTRLPKGHTHEDIDGCFGIIWSALCTEPLVTMDDWKAAVEKMFDGSAIKAEVRDLWIIPDYASIIEPCVIANLGKLHREQNTQHQWRFRAVERHQYFPFGCKTTYRAYSSDCVVEFIRKPRLTCISEIGRYTGLEATRLYCRWFPSRECDPNRPNVEGFYLLQNIPSIALFPGAIVPPPAALPQNAIDKIKSCLHEIRSRFHIIENFAVREWWKNFEKRYLPPSNDSMAYLNQLRRQYIPYHVPLQTVLYGPDTIVPRTFELDIDDYAEYEANFQWPEVFARATNAVASTLFNPHPPPPREYATSDMEFQDQISRWSFDSALFYHNTLERYTNEQLKALLVRKVRYSGNLPSSAGNLSYIRDFIYIL